jgi:hypothetical protein
MFLGQVLSADWSCQNSVAQANVNRLLEGLPAASQSTASYCAARKRLPSELVRLLAAETAAAMNDATPDSWLCRGRHVKLADGSTILMQDTKANQARYPQHGQQEEGAGYPIARLVGVISLSHGAILDIRIGPYKGKGTGELSLFENRWTASVRAI